MPLSPRNTRLELDAIQVTGPVDGKAGVYTRLLQDKEGKYYYDIRYFGFNEDRGTYIESNRGVIFNEEQVLEVRRALKRLWDQSHKPLDPTQAVA